LYLTFKEYLTNIRGSEACVFAGIQLGRTFLIRMPRVGFWTEQVGSRKLTLKHAEKTNSF